MIFLGVRKVNQRALKHKHLLEKYLAIKFKNQILKVWTKTGMFLTKKGDV